MPRLSWTGKVDEGVREWLRCGAAAGGAWHRDHPGLVITVTVTVTDDVVVSLVVVVEGLGGGYELACRLVVEKQVVVDRDRGPRNPSVLKRARVPGA